MSIVGEYSDEGKSGKSVEGRPQSVSYTHLQPDIREEMKKAIYYHLQYEVIATVTREVSVMNKFSKYLKENILKWIRCV